MWAAEMDAVPGAAVVRETSEDPPMVDKDAILLVTGANGFIGTAVVSALLSRGFRRLRCLVRAEGKAGRLRELAKSFPGADVEIVTGNLLSPEDCARAAAGVSVVYHLAAGVEKSFPGCFLNSVVTTRNLLDALCREEALLRFVNISSIAVYSNRKIGRRGLLDESCEVDTRFVERYEAYTYGKAKQDELVREYGQRGLPYVIVRPSVVFGPGKAKITDRIGTSVFGVFLHLGLRNRIPLTFVDNCADAIVLAGLTKGIAPGEVFNIMDDDLPTSRQFLRQYKRRVRSFLSIPVPYPVWFAFCAAWERYSKWSEGQLPPVFNRAGCRLYWGGNRYSNAKAKQLLGWRPRVPMQDAMERFFAYMRERETTRS